MSSPVLFPSLDEEQRREAINPLRSFIVQAPAGSGKTELLIQRHLRLLSSVSRPEAIVAITFTIKAASEMRERILCALREAQGGDVPVTAHKALTFQLAQGALKRNEELGWNLLENPSRLRIQTIDALCGSIVAQMPWLARLGSPPAIQEKAEHLYEEAARRTVMLLAGDRDAEAVEVLLEQLDNDAAQARNLLAKMLERRDQWLSIVTQTDEDERESLEEVLSNIISDALKRADALIHKHERDAILRAAARYWAAKGDIPLGFAAWPSADLDGKKTWVAIANLLLTGGGTWRKRLDVNCGFPPNLGQAKKDCQALISRLSVVPCLLEALAEIQTLPPPRYSDQQWKITGSFLKCLKLAAAQLKLVFRQRGEVDFSEIALAADYALGSIQDPSDLAFRLDSRIDHLLIDEFQDTSVSQFAFLSKLLYGWTPGDGRTVFVVGDPMQSIYRFRKAEVGLFLEARDFGFGAIRPEALRLVANYRSNMEIVQRANEIFEQIFPKDDDVAEGAVRYEPSQSVLPPREERSVHFHAFATNDDRGEANRVVELVRQARARRPQGTVGVLVRARSHLPAITTALRNAGLRYRALEIDPLGQRQVVQDLLSLTRAMLHLGDRVSWLAILRAPWCGLSLADLHTLMTGKDNAALVYSLLSSNLPLMSDDGRPRVSRLLAVLKNAFEDRGRWPLRRWVERTWQMLGGPACVGEESLADAADYFDRLEALQHGADLPNLDQLSVFIEDLFARPDPTASDFLEILTIHKAKGLEFDTVIVPGLGRAGATDENALVLFNECRRPDGSVERLIAPRAETGAAEDPIYKHLKNIEQRKERNEWRRQLYVAFTRAKSELHLLGAAQVNSEGEVIPPGKSYLKDLWKALRPDERACFEEAATLAESPRASVEGPPSPGLRRLPADWAPPSPPSSVWWHDEPTTEAHAPSFEWVGSSLRHSGTVVHAILQRIARGRSRDVSASAVRNALAQLGVPPVDLEDSVKRVTEAVASTLASARGGWILDHHSESRYEYEVTGVVDGEIVRGTVDRTFVDEEGTRWIIDYKTSVHEGGRLNEFLDEQMRRYRGQLDRYARLLEPLGQPVRLGLYFPLLDAWREWPARGRPETRVQATGQLPLF